MYYCGTPRRKSGRTSRCISGHLYPIQYRIFLSFMQVLENISLRPYNTFGIDAKARYFVHIRSVEGLQQLPALDVKTKLPLLVLGGGSNLLLMDDFEGLVLKIDIKGIEKIK